LLFVVKQKKYFQISKAFSTHNGVELFPFPPAAFPCLTLLENSEFQSNFSYSSFLLFSIGINDQRPIRIWSCEHSSGAAVFRWPAHKLGAPWDQSSRTGALSADTVGWAYTGQIPTS
jgi:hypothetical protein